MPESYVVYPQVQFKHVETGRDGGGRLYIRTAFRGKWIFEVEQMRNRASGVVRNILQRKLQKQIFRIQGELMNPEMAPQIANAPRPDLNDDDFCRIAPTKALVDEYKRYSTGWDESHITVENRQTYLGKLNAEISRRQRTQKHDRERSH